MTALRDTLKEVERKHITRALKKTKGNMTKAAEVLGVSRAGIYLKLREHEIDPDFYRPAQ